MQLSRKLNRNHDTDSSCHGYLSAALNQKPKSRLKSFKEAECENERVHFHARRTLLNVTEV